MDCVRQIVEGRRLKGVAYSESSFGAGIVCKPNWRPNVARARGLNYHSEMGLMVHLG